MSFSARTPHWLFSYKSSVHSHCGCLRTCRYGLSTVSNVQFREAFYLNSMPFHFPQTFQHLSVYSADSSDAFVVEINWWLSWGFRSGILTFVVFSCGFGHWRIWLTIEQLHGLHKRNQPELQGHHLPVCRTRTDGNCFLLGVQLKSRDEDPPCCSVGVVLDFL